MSRISPQRPRPLDDETRERQRILGEAAKKIEIAQQGMVSAKEKAKQVEAATRAEALQKVEAANQAFNRIREKERLEEEAQQAREEATRRRFLPAIELTISSTHNQEDEKGQIFTVYIISVSSPTNAFVPWHVGRRFIEFCQLDDVLRRTVLELPALPPKTTPLANKLDPGVVANRIVELQHYLDFLAPLYQVRLLPVFKKFLETNKKYADETYDPPDPKSYYVDCIILECQGLLQREFEPRSYMDYIPGLGKTWNRATFVRGTNGEQEYFTTPIPEELYPVWNEDCTWHYQEGDEGIMRLQVMDKGRNVDTIIGEVRVDLYALKEGEVLDLLEDIKLGRGYGGGKLHVILFKTTDPAKGILSYRGTPLHAIPLRVEAGDLFLMNSSYFLTHGTKLATMSQWDHVAMAVRLPGKARLRFFESTMDGVEANYTLESSVAAYLWSSKLAVRRLVAARTPEMMEALSAFVKQVNGRPYKTSPIQLVRAWASANETEDMSSLFCSQLIAAAYRSMGLIRDDVIADNFLPSDFAGDLKGSIITGKLTALVVFPMKKREYHFISTVDVPVGSPSAAAAIAKTLAPEEVVDPWGRPASLLALQEVRDKERRHREKKTRREKATKDKEEKEKEKEKQEEKSVVVEPTPGADASPTPVEAQPHAHKSRRDKKDKKERHHRRHKNNTDEANNSSMLTAEASDVDSSVALLSVLEAKVSATDKEMHTTACSNTMADSKAKFTAALNYVKNQLLTTAFAEGNAAFRASLLSDRIDVLLARLEQHTAPMSIPVIAPKAASDRRASSTGGSLPESMPRSWNEARMEKHGASDLTSFGSHRSSSSGTTALPTSTSLPPP